MDNVAPPRAGRKEWIGLAVLVLPCLLVSMDMSVLAFALPFLGADLDPTGSQLLWIMDIYGFLLAGLLITMGTLGDRIGRRRLLLIGAAAFGVASVLAAYSTSADMLIATRALLGVAGATLAPSTLSLIRNMFHDPRQRRTAIAVWTAGFSGGALVGPLAGGLLLEAFWWGSVFLVNVPFMLALLALGRWLLPEFRPATAGRFDLLSASLSLGAVLAVIYGVKKFAEAGFGVLPATAVLVGLVVGAAFIRRQRGLADPLIDVRLFRNRSFSTSIAVSGLTMFAMVGFMFFSTQYFQLVLGLRPFVAALWNLPVVAVMPVGALLAAFLVRRIRPGSVVGTGLALVAVGFLVLTQVSGTRPSLVVPLLGFGIMVIGISAVMTLASDMVVGSAPPARAGAASAISETGAEFGGALGIAILGSVGAAIYRREVVDTVPGGLPDGAVAAARETLPGAVEVAGQLPGPLAEALRLAAFEAFAHGIQLTAVVAAVIMAGTAVLAAVLLRHVEPDGRPDGGEVPEPVQRDEPVASS